MSRYWFDIGLITLLLLLNGLFAGSELALVSLREGQLRTLERSTGRRERALVRLARDPNRYLGTIQLGITLAGYLASAAAAVTLAEPLVPALEFLGGAAEAVAIAAVTIVLAAVNIIIGELVPKRLAMQYPARWALLVAAPLDRLATVTSPMVWLLSRATDVLVRLLGGKSDSADGQLSADELRELVAVQRVLSPEQREMIAGALEIHERVLREILVPRRSVVALPSDMSVGESRKLLVTSGHSRAPVVRSRDLDDVIGVVHLRDLLVEEDALETAARPILNLPDSLPVSEALRRFKTEREQFALVVDERGGSAGIVTLEDVLEEIVGEIYDETDRDVLAAQRLPDGSFTLPGNFPFHDLDDLGVHLEYAPPGDYTTVAGLVLVALGQIPRSGEKVALTDWSVEVSGVTGNTITEIRLVPRVAGDGRRATDGGGPSSS
ncbi:membrane protein [Mycolicibacterium psychrotolerans]|uniref:Membrane protein n=1 Tax=Mycolicibacterium psychrotolerans TaxID=216929 RepID=A0A7I7MA66_9MYCO|nr:hemolysin family protein [Mycolicibacterium psychrotolerans]BBX68906.1 membrane protein [Mycolicibacterium psychrotolerans]